jgi:hypothetical protein
MSDTPKQSPRPFTHKVSKKRVGVFEIDDNSICDAKGNIMIAENYDSHYDCHGDFISLAPGDWHLFATAPEMLEALKMLYALVQGECPSLLSDDSGGDVRCAMMVESAIAKAEGRQG